MNIPMNVLSFAQDNIDVYKAFRDYFNHFKAENLKDSKVSYEYDRTVSFEEKGETMHTAILDEIGRVAGLGKMEGFSAEVWASHPTFKWASFAVINALVDMILPETLVETVGLYTDIVTGGYGDSFAFDVKPRDLFVVSKAGRGKRVSEVHKNFVGQVTVVPSEHDITVQVSLYRVLAGKENLADFVMKCVRSIETEMTLDSYNAFNAAMTALPTTPSGGVLKVVGYTQDDAVSLAQRVTAFNQGQKAVFVGTQIALNKILPTGSAYRYMLDSEYVKIGYIRTAFGYDAICLPQVADWKTPFKAVLDDERIYVLSPSSQKIIKMCIEGSTLAITSDTYANANLTQTTTLKKMFGTAVATNAVAGLITL
jgi:hypothetical protein